MELNNILSERIIKSAYMGFLLDKNSNLFLEKKVSLSKKEIVSYINIFNKHTNHKFNKIKISDSQKGGDSFVVFKVAGSKLELTTEVFTSIISSLEFLIQDNIYKINKSDYIDVFDLNTLDKLDLHSTSSLSKSYLATNNKTYLFENLHLYHIENKNSKVSFY